MLTVWSVKKVFSSFFVDTKYTLLIGHDGAYVWLIQVKLVKKKVGGGKLVLPPSTFQSGEGDCPQLLCP
jgi:hypothetical protein